jgi:hypothetical protein
MVNLTKTHYWLKCPVSPRLLLAGYILSTKLFFGLLATFGYNLPAPNGFIPYCLNFLILYFFFPGILESKFVIFTWIETFEKVGGGGIGIRCSSSYYLIRSTGVKFFYLARISWVSSRSSTLISKNRGLNIIRSGCIYLTASVNLVYDFDGCSSVVSISSYLLLSVDVLGKNEGAISLKIENFLLSNSLKRSLNLCLS